jgi:hypothetical protein
MDRHIHRLLVLLPMIYGVIGVCCLTPFIYIVAFIPKEEFFSHPGAIVWVIFPFVNAIVCFVISYSFFTSRTWGCYIIITYNMLWLTYLLFIVVAGIILQDFRLNGPTLGLFLIMLSLVMITAFCLRRDVRTIMGRKSA